MVDVDDVGGVGLVGVVGAVIFTVIGDDCVEIFVGDSIISAFTGEVNNEVFVVLDISVEKVLRDIDAAGVALVGVNLAAKSDTVSVTEAPVNFVGSFWVVASVGNTGSKAKVLSELELTDVPDEDVVASLFLLLSQFSLDASAQPFTLNILTLFIIILPLFWLISGGGRLVMFGLCITFGACSSSVVAASSVRLQLS